MITMVTFLRGGAGYYPSLNIFQQLPTGSRLLATVNNSHDSELVDDMGGESIFIEPWDGKGGEWGQHKYVASLWNAAIPASETSLTLLMDDDVAPKPGALSLFLQGFQDEDAVCTCAVYPFKQSPPGLSLYPVFYTTGMSPVDGASIENGREQVFTAAMGMSLWRTAVLQNCLPVSVIDKLGSPAGTEYDLGLKIKALDKKIYIDGRARCEHLTI